MRRSSRRRELESAPRSSGPSATRDLGKAAELAYGRSPSSSSGCDDEEAQLASCSRRRLNPQRRGRPTGHRRGRRASGPASRSSRMLEGEARADPHRGAPARARGRPGRGGHGGRERGPALPRRPLGPEPPDRQLHLPRPDRRRQDGAAGRSPSSCSTTSTRWSRIDMSEYMEKHAVSAPDRRAARLRRLRRGWPAHRGRAPPSLRGDPARRDREGPPDVFNVLLQILDDGRLTDGKGRTVDFPNTVMIMTSNIGSQEIILERINEHMREKVNDVLRRNLPAGVPEPVDETVIFHGSPRGHHQDRQRAGRDADRAGARARVEIELTDDARRCRRPRLRPDLRRPPAEAGDPEAARRPVRPEAARGQSSPRATRSGSRPGRRRPRVLDGRRAGRRLSRDPGSAPAFRVPRPRRARHGGGPRDHEGRRPAASTTKAPIPVQIVLPSSIALPGIYVVWVALPHSPRPRIRSSRSSRSRPRAQASRPTAHRTRSRFEADTLRQPGDQRADSGSENSAEQTWSPASRSGRSGRRGAGFRSTPSASSSVVRRIPVPDRPTTPSRGRRPRGHRMGAAEGADGPVALTLVAVDRSNDEDVEAGTRVAGAVDESGRSRSEWPDLALRGSLEAGTGGPGRQRRGGRQREPRHERRRWTMKAAAARARAMPASAAPARTGRGRRRPPGRGRSCRDLAVTGGDRRQGGSPGEPVTVNAAEVDLGEGSPSPL